MALSLPLIHQPVKYSRLSQNLHLIPMHLLWVSHQKPIKRLLTTLTIHFMIVRFVAFIRQAPPSNLFKASPDSTIKPLRLAIRFMITAGICVPHTKHIFHDDKPDGHGRVNLHKAIKVSCDTYFYNLAVMLGIKHIDDCPATIWL